MMKHGRNTVRTLLALLLSAVLGALCGCGSTEEAPPATSSVAGNLPSEPAAGPEPQPGRTEQLYASVEVLPDGGTSPLLSRPADCPQEIGPALGTMLSLYKSDPNRLYHVAFCLNAVAGREDRDAVAGKLRNPDALFADEWVALSDVASPESGGDADGWFYYLFTADEVRALASVGLQCRLVGNGETLSAGQLTQEQAIEHICQFNGDSFRAAQAKASE